MGWLAQVTYWFVWIGALNWGLIGFFNYNLVDVILPGFANTVYMLMGLSAAYVLLMKKDM